MTKQRAMGKLRCFSKLLKTANKHKSEVIMVIFSRSFDLYRNFKPLSIVYNQNKDLKCENDGISTVQSVEHRQVHLLRTKTWTTSQGLMFMISYLCLINLFEPVYNTYLEISMCMKKHQSIRFISCFFFKYIPNG